MQRTRHGLVLITTMHQFCWICNGVCYGTRSWLPALAAVSFAMSAFRTCPNLYAVIVPDSPHLSQDDPLALYTAVDVNHCRLSSGLNLP